MQIYPINFPTSVTIDGIQVEYSDLREVCQGGPEIGSININGAKLDNALFGGPLLWEKQMLYVPKFVKSFLGTGFKLVRLNLDTCEEKELTDMYDLILLKEIRDGKIYFFTDLENSKEKLNFADV